MAEMERFTITSVYRNVLPWSPAVVFAQRFSADRRSPFDVIDPVDPPEWEVTQGFRWAGMPGW